MKRTAVANKRTRAFLMHAGSGVFAPGMAGSHAAVGA